MPRSKDDRTVKVFDRSVAATRSLEAVIPGGAMTYARGADQYPEGMWPVVDRGSGCEIWDLDGNKFIEFGIGLRSIILGHAHAQVNEAARIAMDNGCGFVRPSRYDLAAAEALLAAVPSMEMVKFAKNGSDVTTAAVKLARAATGRLKIAICRDHPFFSTDDWFIGTTPMNAGIPDQVRRETVTFAYGDISSLEELLSHDPEGFACVVLEPEKYERAPAGYLKSIRQTCDRFGCCLVFDEMITGFRHYYGGVHLRDNVCPDLVTFGKAIGNGFAVSALMGRRDLMELGGFNHDKDRVFLLSTTHGAETPALAAMIATLRILKEESVLERIATRGERLRQEVNDAAGELGIADHFSVIGFPTNLVFETRDVARQPSQAFRTLFLQECIQRGLLAPSLVLCDAHTEAIIDQSIEIIRDALAVYRRALDEDISGFLKGRPVQPAIRRFR